MKVVIIGGTGLIGKQLVTRLENAGHEAVAASPSTGVNILNGDGLAEVLTGADVVVDVSNSPSFEDAAAMSFFKTAGGNMLPAEKKAGVQHHIVLSIVGTPKLQASGYFRAKQVQEDLVESAGVPYTIVHATQFFEFAPGIVQMSTVGDQVIVPDANIQPIASHDVVTFLAQRVVDQPVYGVVEVGGPEKYRIVDWIKQSVDGKEVLADAKTGYAGAPVSGDELVPGKDGYLGETTYEEWVKSKV